MALKLEMASELGKEDVRVGKRANGWEGLAIAQVMAAANRKDAEVVFVPSAFACIHCRRSQY